MDYLQADTSKSTLYVYPQKRDWADYKDDKHFEYHTATLLAFGGQPFAVEVEAQHVPWSAVLHVPLFARIAKHARATHKNQLIRVNIIGASRPTRVICTLLAGVVPATVLNKLCFIDEHQTEKKRS